MEEIIKFLKDEGYEFEVGCREKERRKIIGEEIDSLKKTNDEKKIKLAKRLSWYYFNFHNISYLIKKNLIFLLKKISMGCIIFVLI